MLLQSHPMLLDENSEPDQTEFNPKSLVKNLESLNSNNSKRTSVPKKLGATTLFRVTRSN